jgi:hypothetical protein
MPGRTGLTRILRGYDERGGGWRPPRAASGGGCAARLVEDLVEEFGRPLLTVAEAASRLNVSNSAIRTLCRRGLLPYGRVLNPFDSGPGTSNVLWSIDSRRRGKGADLPRIRK